MHYRLKWDEKNGHKGIDLLWRADIKQNNIVLKVKRKETLVLNTT